MALRPKFLNRKTAVDTSTTTRIRITNPWHAVSVVCGRHGCPPAQRLAQERFLSGQAPKLPLAHRKKALKV
jgi:hypothetical protein